VFRRVPKNWVGPAGTYCQIIGRWSDGTVRLQVGLIDTQYPDRKLSIDGRFPGWVAQPIAGRPVLPSNVPAKPRRPLRAVFIITLLAAIEVAAYVARLHGAFR